MDLIITIVGALIFFALIILSVLLHELGHLIPAKVFGIKASQYFAGFGKTLWSKQIGETEYGFKLFPLGGYVRLVGMYSPRRQGAKNTWLQRVADRAREAEADEIADTDESRLFYTHPVWQKLIVMAGGIVTNLLLSFLLFQSVFATMGMSVQTTKVHAVDECMIEVSRAGKICQATDPKTPAFQAGLQAGDRIVEFNGTQITQWRQLSDLIRANRDHEARIVVERSGQRVSLQPVHTVINGVNDRLDPSKIIQAGFLGYTPAVEQKKVGPGETIAAMWEMSAQAIYALGTLPVKVWNVAVDVITGKPRDPSSPMSIVGASRVAGEVAGSAMKLGDKVGIAASLLGSLNLFLFWLNVVPLPPMDGGHIVGALWEAIRRGGAKLRGKPDPGPVDTAKMLPVAYVVGGALLVMGVILILADVVSPVKIF